MGKIKSLIVEGSFFLLPLSFLFGVFAASFFYFTFSSISLIFLVTLIIFIYSYRLSTEYKRVLLVVTLSLTLFAFGILRYELKNSINQNSALLSLVGRNISIQSIIISEPQNKENYREYLIFAPNNKEKVLVKAEPYPEFQYGDEIIFTGKLSTPKNFETDNGQTFDYVAYLRKDNIKYVISFAKGEFISNKNGNKIKDSLYKIKNRFLQNINNYIVEPQSSLLAGILLGVDSLGAEIENIFRRTGIVHIVVLSGYNITIVAESLIKFFSFLPKNFALGTGVMGIILFAIMVGGTPSVLRASLMALLVLLARFTGRNYDITRALLIAGFFMVLWNPSILVFDTSFQLSFLSTIALIWISPIINKRLTCIPERFGLREITSATISTQIFVLPLLLYKVGQFSIVGLPVNLLVLGFIPAIMFLGFLVGFFGFVSHWLTLPFAFLTQLLLTYVLKVVGLFNLFPFASVKIEHFSAPIFWLVYLCYGFLFWKYKINKKEKK